MRTAKCRVVKNQPPEVAPKIFLVYMFVNVLAMDFDLYPADSVELAVVFSSFLLYRSIPVGGVWNNYKNYYNTNILLLFLLNKILEAVPQAEENCRFFWLTLLEAATTDFFWRI